MDSRKIADVLEKKHPSPSLHLDSPILKKVEELAPQCVMPLGPVFIPRVPRFMLNSRSAEYFERTREARFGMSLSQLEKEKGGESAWKAAEPKWKELGTLLKAEGGPFFMGKTGKHIGSILSSPRAWSMNTDHLGSVVCRSDRCRCITLLCIWWWWHVSAGERHRASLPDALWCVKSLAWTRWSLSSDLKMWMLPRSSESLLYSDFTWSLDFFPSPSPEVWAAHFTSPLFSC